MHLDGRPLGSTPLKDLAVSPGMHRVEFKREGRSQWTSRWSVGPGQQDRFTANRGEGKDAALSVEQVLVRKGKVCSVDGWCWQSPLPQAMI